MQILRGKLFLLLVILVVKSDDYFSSISSMKKLQKLNQFIMLSLEEHINKPIEVPSKLKKIYYEEFVKLDAFLSQTKNQFFKLPTNQFHIIYHLTKKYDETLRLINGTIQSETRNNLLPSDQDLIGAGIGLLRLQEVYNVSTEDMANGDLSDEVKPFRSLSAEECGEMIKIAKQEEMYGFCVAWAVEALKRLENSIENEDEESDLKYSFLNSTRSCTGQMRKTQLAYYVTKHMAEISLESKELNDLMKYYVFLLGQDENFDENYVPPMPLLLDQLKELEPRTTKQMQYEETCAGGKDWEERMDSMIYTSELYCDMFTNNNHPMLILSPVKREILFLDPLIIRFHEIVREDEIDWLNQFGEYYLKRAKVDFVNSTITKDRIQKTLFISAVQFPLVAKLFRDIEIISDLNVSIFGDGLQIGNYGVGGEYKFHYDYFDIDQLTSLGLGHTQRLATFMYYLSDVERGGATVFPIVGARVTPIKGSGVLWYNLLKNGEPDTNTLHGACPVLVGIKTVANRWISVKNQSLNWVSDVDEDL